MTQAVNQAMDQSIKDTISKSLASQRVYCTQMERPDSGLVPIQTGSQFSRQGNYVSHSTGVPALTHTGGRM